jgi:hypothetical protein
LPLYDTSAGTADRVTVGNLFTAVNTLGAETAPATDDALLLYDTSAGTADKITLSNTLKVVNGLTLLNAPTYGDFLPVYDTSATDIRKTDVHYIGVGRQQRWVPASDMFVDSGAAGPSRATTTLGTDPVVLSTLAFDPASTEAANFYFAMPKRWANSTITYKIYWYATGSGGAASAVVWNVRSVGVANAVTLAATYGSGVSTTSVRNGTSELVITPVSSNVTQANSTSENELLIVQVRRIGGNASDTHTLDAPLIGVMVMWTSNVNTDSDTTGAEPDPA